MRWRIPLFKIYWNEDCVNAVEEVIKSGMHWAVGLKILEFEKALTNYVKSRFAITFNSGTSALHAVLLAYNVGSGDEVIVPSFTFIATANAPLFVGAKPVFADIEEETLGLDPEDVKEKISEKTKAIITVHYGGCPSKVKALGEIAEDHNLILIEDAAEALGAKVGKSKVGTFGDSAVFSFCQNKIITTGEGGAVTTDNKEVYERLKLIRSHGRFEKEEYFSSTSTAEYITLGYNFRLCNILAALGLAQLKCVDKIIEMRREKAALLTQKLSKVKKVLPPNPPPNYYHVYQLYTIRVEKELRTSLINYLASKGVMTKIYFSPVHLTTFYKETLGFSGGELPLTEKISEEVLSLPIYPTMTKSEIEYITNNIYQFFGE